MPGRTRPLPAAVALATFSDAVEEAGLGPAQLRLFGLAAAVPLSVGLYMATIVLVATEVVEDFGLRLAQRTVLLVSVHAGICIGALCGGCAADYVGRRPVANASMLAMAASGIAASQAPSWSVLLASIAIASFSGGLGLPAIMALGSEVSPMSWRLIVRGGGDVCFDLGIAVAALLASIQDPTMQHLQWRRLLFGASVLPGVLGLLAFPLLEESPVFLGACGERDRASLILDQMQLLNGGGSSCVVGSLRLQSSAAAEAGRGAPPPQPGTAALGRWLRLVGYTTLLAAGCCFGLLDEMGIFVNQQIHKVMRAPGAMTGRVASGTALDVAVITLSAILAGHTPRPKVLLFALMSGAASMWCLGVAGSGIVHSGGVFANCAFKLGLFGFHWVPALGYLALYQLSVEAFPTLEAATAAGVALVGAHLGAAVTSDVLASLVADIGHWSFFCYALALSFSVAAFVSSRTLVPLWVGCGQETRPLLGDKTSTGYV